ncbi:hypothetical protein [Massilia sp. CF038]|uniref:hypothetical protein n=1 Tax=Massilia sp. CF038 TaxID=1881045 RepID=UPI000923D349|nr:hypothetical protein [Massilia sp. CF038]SHG47674.1 hypothetical protein SAMN05428948_0648 [Massilia sp. CF038]
MQKLKVLLLSFVVGAAALAACSPKAAKVETPVAVTPQAVQGAVKLLGQWNGPEGTYLQIAGADGKYAVTIKNLDGPRTFQGSGTGDTITFERDGKPHTIRPSDGAATGMKWLADKKNCVTIEAGEGYCRD